MALNEVTPAPSKALSEGKEVRTGPTLCDDCDSGNPACCYCQDCNWHFCVECKHSHIRSKRTKGHLLVVLETSQNLVKCPKHPTNNLKYFCKSCNDIACDKCSTTLHALHHLSPLNDCVKEMKDLCLDCIKIFQGPFDNMKTGQMEIKVRESSFLNSCDQTKSAIQTRKQTLIDLITTTSDKALQEVDKAKTEIGSLYVTTKSELRAILSSCEQTVAPLVLGPDVETIVRRVMFLKTKIRQADEVLSNLNILQMCCDVHLEGSTESIKVIDDATHGCFNVIRNLPGKVVAPTPPVISVQPTKAVLECDEQIPTYCFLSKHISPNAFTVDCEGDRHIKLMSFVDKPVLDTNSKSFPKALYNGSNSILTLNETHHIIISDDSVNLCGATGVLHTAPHTSDHYIPDRLAYVNKDLFVSVCVEKAQVRYHSAKDLSVLKTYDLNIKLPDRLAWYILCTSNGDWLIRSDKKEITQYTSNGDRKRGIPIDTAFFDYDQDAICIDNHNNIFGIDEGGQIHMFDTDGNNCVLGKLECEPDDLWGSGVDDFQRLYISYSAKNGTERIGRYKLV